MFTYTQDPPTLTHKETIRKGYRLPRSILLPPYLMSNPFFIEWLDAMDELFDERVDAKIYVLQNLRNMWVSNPALETKIEESQLLDLDDWSIPEQSIVLKQLNTLGLQLGVPTVMFDQYSFVNLSRYIGMYWMAKGTGTLMDFINFCTGYTFELKNCWTKDYKTFYPEGDDRVGEALWKGGEWYPTTHVQFNAINPDMTDVNLLAQLFFEIANYNLVLYSINFQFDLMFEVPGAENLGINFMMGGLINFVHTCPSSGVNWTKISVTSIECRQHYWFNPWLLHHEATVTITQE